MPATFTANGYYATPRLTPGVSLQRFTFSYNGRSASVSDVIYIGKLLNRSVVLDVRVTGAPGTDQSPVSSTASGLSPECTWKVGTPNNDAFFGPAGSLTVSAARSLQAVSGYPKTISASSDVEGPQIVPIIITRSVGTSTVTGSIQVTMLVQSPDV